MIKKNSSITIEQVENGFALYPQFDSRREGYPGPQKVFQSMNELTDFLDDHFDFRSGILLADLPHN